MYMYIENILNNSHNNTYFRTSKVPTSQGGASLSSWRKDDVDLKFSIRRKVWTGLESGEENRIDRSKPLTATTHHPSGKPVCGGKAEKASHQEKIGQRTEPSDFLFNVKNSQSKKLATDHFLRYLILQLNHTTSVAFEIIVI